MLQVLQRVFASTILLELLVKIHLLVIITEHTVVLMEFASRLASVIVQMDTQDQIAPFLLATTGDNIVITMEFVTALWAVFVVMVTLEMLVKTHLLHPLLFHYLLEPLYHLQCNQLRLNYPHVTTTDLIAVIMVFAMY